MKKNFLPIIALALSATACVSDADLDVADNKGYINVSVSADNSMETRAKQTVTADDLNNHWIIKVGETVWTGPTQSISAGTYTVTATNYEDINAALTANESYGDAWYSGETSVQIKAGEQANATIDCERAKNARVRADIQPDMPSITDVQIKVYKAGDTDRQPVLSIGNTTAYFEASTESSRVEIIYVISYKYGSNSNRTTLNTKTLTLGMAAQENVIKITSNTNGSINISVSYDNTFDNGGEESITIDAATGNEVNS